MHLMISTFRREVSTAPSRSRHQAACTIPTDGMHVKRMIGFHWLFVAHLWDVFVWFACVQVAIKIISSSKFGFNKRAQEAILVEVEAMRVRLFVSATNVTWNECHVERELWWKE